MKNLMAKEYQTAAEQALIAAPMFLADLEDCNTSFEHGFNPFESYKEILEYYKENVSFRPNLNEWVLDNINKNRTVFDITFQHMIDDWSQEYTLDDHTDEYWASFQAGYHGYIAASCMGIVDEKTCNDLPHTMGQLGYN